MHINIVCDAEYVEKHFNEVAQRYIDRPITEENVNDLCLNLSQKSINVSDGVWGKIVRDVNYHEIAIHVFRVDPWPFVKGFEPTRDQVLEIVGEYKYRENLERKRGRFNIAREFQKSHEHLTEVIYKEENK